MHNSTQKKEEKKTLFQSFNCALGRRRVNEWKIISVAINYMYIETTAMKKQQSRKVMYVHRATNSHQMQVQFYSFSSSSSTNSSNSNNITNRSTCRWLISISTEIHSLLLCILPLLFSAVSWQSHWAKPSSLHSAHRKASLSEDSTLVNQESHANFLRCEFQFEIDKNAKRK